LFLYFSVLGVCDVNL